MVTLTSASRHILKQSILRLNIKNTLKNYSDVVKKLIRTVLKFPMCYSVYYIFVNTKIINERETVQRACLLALDLNRNEMEKFKFTILKQGEVQVP